jgi:hypothetical protein
VFSGIDLFLTSPRWGGKESREHSKQEVILGIMTRACPLSPSVPPSIRGIIVLGSGSPSSSYWTLRRPHKSYQIEFWDQTEIQGFTQAGTNSRLPCLLERYSAIVGPQCYPNLRQLSETADRNPRRNPEFFPYAEQLCSRGPWP